MSYKISIIMPIYNAEKTLNNSIRSIINQSIGFENIELILVDDASKDNSKNIIDSYCKKYDNIIPYYSSINHGYPAFGRNVGLNMATTEYIMFIDNDDEYDKDICRRFYESISSENVDIVCCNKIMVDSICIKKEQIGYTNGMEYGEKVLIENDDILLFDSTVVWNKIFKKEIISNNHIKFIENSMGDDFAFIMDYFLNSKKLIYLKDYGGYYWHINSGSLSHSITDKYLFEFIDIFKYTYSQIKNKNKENFSNDIYRFPIKGRILETSYSKFSFNTTKKILNKISDFEHEINFDCDLNEKWVNRINKLIYERKFFLVFLFLRMMYYLRKSTLLRKLNRKLSK